MCTWRGSDAGLSAPVVTASLIAVTVEVRPVARGARLMRGTRVTGAAVSDDHTTLQTTSGDVRGRWVVNAAGLGADHLDAEFGHCGLESQHPGEIKQPGRPAGVADGDHHGRGCEL